MFPFHFKLNTMKFPYKKETKLMCFVELLYNVLSKVTHNSKILDNLRSFMPLDNAKEEQIPQSWSLSSVTKECTTSGVPRANSPSQ